LLVDKNFDVGEGTSKGNSAIIHTGFDASPGTLESRLVTRASRRWPELAERFKIPFRQNGALLLALDDDQAQQLSKLHQKAITNGVEDVEVVGPDEVGRLEPNAAPTARGGLLVPRESIVDPFAVSIAFAEVAVANGVDVLLGCRVIGVENASEAVKKLVDDDGNRIGARIVVNVAGLGSRQLTETYLGELFDINPRRGQFLIYDKNIGPTVERILLPVPTAKTKGKLVTPTIFGNLLSGPTAEDLPLGDPNATSTTIEGLQEVRESAIRMCPKLADHRPIATYAGARCNCTQGSYQVRLGDNGHAGVLTVTGVRSTGLTSSPALAEYLVEQMCEAGWLTLTPDPDAVDGRPESCWPGWWRRPYEDPQRMTTQPDYGRMVCFCEQISQQEIVDALDSPLRPRTLDAVKRRARVLTGRCQGFNCLVRIADVISRHRKVPLESVTKHGPGSELLPDGHRTETTTGATP
jgi:glycerol-3-phosphate dehydrogenase